MDYRGEIPNFTETSSGPRGSISAPRLVPRRLMPFVVAGTFIRPAHVGATVPFNQRDALIVGPAVDRGNTLMAVDRSGVEGGAVPGTAPTMYWRNLSSNSWPWGSTDWRPSAPGALISPPGSFSQRVGNLQVSSNTTRMGRLGTMTSRSSAAKTSPLDQAGR